ncbi:MAG: hypothetical protein BGO67_02360 [Alphaproteobacteria bacterium 41-28]|nr:MAG: hypothetical protein BGO67_02360 [Alphaproteobacteria bacterium 41-28]
MNNDLLSHEYAALLESLKNRVATARYQAVRTVNRELILLYHYIGTEILKKQASQGWGAKVIDRLSKDLSSAFPDMKGFSSRNLKYMRLFAETYPELEFVQQVVAQLPWGHNVFLLDLVKKDQERIFYIQSAIKYGWSRSVLVHQIELNLYHRQGKIISNFKETLPASQSDLVQRTLKDPYIFDFLSLGNEAEECEIERGLIKQLEKFLLELGEGFAFLGRQYHLEVGDEDFYIDLVFYHVKLRCYVVIELKVGKFKPEYSGKLNFYLSAVDDLLKHPDDNPSIGLILCKSKNNVIAEYSLRYMTKAMGLSEYQLTESLPKNLQTVLPSIKELETELSKTIQTKMAKK